MDTVRTNRDFVDDFVQGKNKQDTLDILNAYQVQCTPLSPSLSPDIVISDLYKFIDAGYGDWFFSKMFRNRSVGSRECGRR